MKLTDLIKDQTAWFVEFHSGTMFYELSGSGFRFAVPVDELQGASVGATEKASVFLKWIKRAHKQINRSQG
ncbi:hypothetical protein A3709_20250 [Halioglobus sp. HI00S01]|uniref:hypothetical protein n=1 Tax=Halioglobus sp. HI00S01 TaxID=1822214 RepID=UPI0007C37177|nr:hypothetical protein [Halioglobus sp. HI00S01]KZX57950.1 hypothetical protein A3709_20250 [Halioglobus sp. HI00S01]